MNEIYAKMLTGGMIALIILSGIMATVFVGYVKNIMNKVDDMTLVKPLIDKVDKLVDKFEKISISMEVTRKTTDIKVENLEEKMRRMEIRIDGIEDRQRNNK